MGDPLGVPDELLWESVLVSLVGCPRGCLVGLLRCQSCQVCSFATFLGFPVWQYLSNSHREIEFRCLSILLAWHRAHPNPFNASPNRRSRETNAPPRPNPSFLTANRNGREDCSIALLQHSAGPRGDSISTPRSPAHCLVCTALTKHNIAVGGRDSAG